MNSKQTAAVVGPKAHPISKPHLLIVDDIEANRDMLGRRFERRGFLVSQAESGQEALDAMARGRFDAILLDVMMPDMDGLEVLAKIRRTHSAGELPVIMVTAKNQPSDLAEALANGANDYVTKPVDFTVALARVQAHIARCEAELRIRMDNDALNRLNADLDNTRDKLEEQVRLRTQRLVEANATLQAEIQQRSLAEKKAEYLAAHDPLTGLANRSAFEGRLKSAWESARSQEQAIALLFIDLDGFKAVNDTCGHDTGDELLRALARELTACLTPDSFIGRLGGDEFCVVLPVAQDPGEANALAAGLIETVSNCDAIGGKRILVGASIGIAVSADEEDANALLKRADLAMYRAKRQGGGCYCAYDSVMDREVEHRLQLERELRTALIANELELFYQPIYSLRENRLTGFEALCRWPTQRGFVPPSEFIPLAEETGLIIQLGEWILQQACHEAAKWPLSLKIAVNLSPVQFKSRLLVDVIKSALMSSGLKPSRLELEITEGLLLADNMANLAILEELRLLGIRISMDDFGTGYSSFAYLRSFKFDKVKIDRSFVADISAEKQSRAIVKAVSDLGISFGITTTAEGVETKQQLDYLRAEGCSEIQGNLLSVPVPARKLPALIAAIDAGLLP